MYDKQDGGPSPMPEEPDKHPTHVSPEELSAGRGATTNNDSVLETASSAEVGNLQALTHGLDDDQTFQSVLRSRVLSTPPRAIKKSRRKGPVIEPISSSDRALFPNTESFRVVRESFSPAVEQRPGEGEGTLWDLITPSGMLTVEKGSTTDETETLQDYVTSQRGAEGLKHMLALYQIYVRLTQGIDQKYDLEISLKSVLEYLGMGTHARDRDAQQRLLDTALYLARTYVSLSPKERFAPFLVMEGMRPDKEGNVWIRFHLGQEVYEARFGSNSQVYLMPPAPLLAYNAKRDEQELQLTFFFSEKMAGGSHCAFYFVNLCLLVPLMTLDEITSGQNRTRKALRILYALEQLEKDEWIVRSPHRDIDTALAADVALDKSKREGLSTATTDRLEQLISQYTKQLDAREVKTKRRESLQRLLDIETANEEIVYDHRLKVVFSPGRLLREQISEQQANKQVSS